MIHIPGMTQLMNELGDSMENLGQRFATILLPLFKSVKKVALEAYEGLNFFLGAAAFLSERGISGIQEWAVGKQAEKELKQLASSMSLAPLVESTADAITDSSDKFFKDLARKVQQKTVSKSFGFGIDFNAIAEEYLGNVENSLEGQLATGLAGGFAGQAAKFTKLAEWGEKRAKLQQDLAEKEAETV